METLFQKTARLADHARGVGLPPPTEHKAQIELTWQELDDLNIALALCPPAGDSEIDQRVDALQARLAATRNRL
jgi:hypothetical protein